MSSQLEQFVFNCSICQQERTQRPEPLCPTPLPERPWQKLGTDLFDWKGNKYLLVVDYFSRFIEISRLTGETCSEVVKHMKSIFARHGIPEQVTSDNGPQFSAREFTNFSKSYGFSHSTSTPSLTEKQNEL